MSNFEPSKQHLREVLIFLFHSKKSASEAHRLITETYPDYSVDVRMCQRWFARFKSGDFDTEDKERPGQEKKFEDEELVTLLNEDSCQSQEELALSLGVTQQTISRRLKALGFIQKHGNWTPHNLEPRQIERRLVLSEILLERNKKKGFLHRIVTGDEKWIYYENPKRKVSYVKPGEPGPSTPKRDIHCDKVMLCIWWDQKGVVYYELLRSGQTVDGPLYRTQLMRLKRALKEKRPEWETRHEGLIFHHDNARPHIEKSVKNYLENSGWEVLPHPPYSPDLAPSDYHLFRSMQNALTGIRFTSVEEIKNWLDNWLASKTEKFFWDGIHKLPERWEKVILSDGQYFE